MGPAITAHCVAARGTFTRGAFASLRRTGDGLLSGDDLRHADEGAKLLDAHDMKGDETVMAEWRTLVQAEKEKSNHATVRGPAGDYVHSKRWETPRE